jgi:hypothetical protein
VYLRQGATIDGEVESLLLPHEKARLCETCVSTSVAYPAYTLHVLQQVRTAAWCRTAELDNCVRVVQSVLHCQFEVG